MNKTIAGSWFEFQHHNKPEGVNWNEACAAFTREQWSGKVKEMAGIGMRYAVLMATALDGKAFYPTEILPRYELACDDPLEAALSAADECGVKFFIGAGFFGRWDDPDVLGDAETSVLRQLAIPELASRYAHHPSFHGWYWPNEACAEPYFSDAFIAYVKECGTVARQVTPRAEILIAPYGTRNVRDDDAFHAQLLQLKVDIIAWQDEVGVRKTRVEELDEIFGQLRRIHDRVPRIKLWADMELFEFEGAVYQSALVPAPFERIRGQLEALSPHVDEILSYQYLGLMNAPKTSAFAGNEDSRSLYRDYRAWAEKQALGGPDAPTPGGSL